MSTTFTAIHVLPNGQELTAEFTTSNSARARSVISGRSTDILRIEADAAMKEKHGVRAMGWSIVGGPEQDAPCQWYGLKEAKELGIPLPEPEAVAQTA